MRILLREITSSDIKQINHWRNDKELIDFLGANYMYTSETIDEIWYQNYINNRSKQIRLAIIDDEKNKHIGNVYLTEIQSVNRSAEFSILIGEKEYWSKSIGEDVTNTVINHGFNDINLNRIYLYVLSDNERAIKMYKKLNFKEEGILREAVFKNGEYKDFLLMSILSKEYSKIFLSKHKVVISK